MAGIRGGKEGNVLGSVEEKEDVLRCRKGTGDSSNLARIVGAPTTETLKPLDCPIFVA
jgi:hypothetical protein